jgi:hypothetical protein
MDIEVELLFDLRSLTWGFVYRMFTYVSG